jgi:uncharacterized protein YraI
MPTAPPRPASTPAHTSRGRTRLRLPLALAAALLLASILPMNPAAPAHAATTAWVDTGGDCLNMRTAPGLASSTIRCLDHGTQITLLDTTQALDGFTWQQIQHQGDAGWVANFYITTNPDDVQTIEEPLATPGVLTVPPAGGLTIGTTTEADPAALAAAQSYPVEGIWLFAVASQQFRQYLPGAPAFASTLTSIPAGSVVTIKRAGTLTTTGSPPEASLTVAGSPNQLPTPPIDGITQGISGTTDPNFLVQAQPFTVQSVSYFHVESQQWLVYLPGAPDHAQSLRQGQLRTNSVVTLRRAPDADPPPDAGSLTRFETTITYYYCVPGSNPAAIGDGGGYCGAMANGQTVFAGAAACASDRLGQRFTIEGDPTLRTYTCTDTGGSVLNEHRDIWFMHSDEGYAWWAALGPTAIINILPD